MEKITKKCFIELLTQNKTQNIVIKNRKNTNENSTIIENENLKNLFNNNIDVRYIIKTQTNAVVFNNGSYLYFDIEGIKNFYKKENFLIYINEYTDEFSKEIFTTILIYKII